MGHPAEKRRYDPLLLGTVFLLLITGLAFLYSASAYNGRMMFGDRFYYLKKQAFALSVGLAGMYGAALVDYRRWERLSKAAYAAALILSALVLIAGAQINGSKRWLVLGPVSFQPCEYAKVAVIIFLSFTVPKHIKKMGKTSEIIKTALPVLPLVALVGAGNLSTAVIIFGIAAAIIFISSPKYAAFIWMAAAGILFLGVFLAAESYRLERIAVWQRPEEYEKGYQTLQGLYAIASGGLFGRGFGKSIQKQGFVPEPCNDMIFSIICEETGLAGASFVLLLFFILIWRLFVTASRVKDLAGAFISSGAMAHIMIQVILNIAVVTNSIPNTGVTLPFISCGGTSAVFLLTEMGLVLNVSSQTDRYA